MASKVLFGGLQAVTAGQLGLSPILMAATNSSGGVIGKIIDAQSIVVASTAHELVRARRHDPEVRLQTLDRPGLPRGFS